MEWRCGRARAHSMRAGSRQAVGAVPAATGKMLRRGSLACTVGMATRAGGGGGGAQGEATHLEDVVLDGALQLGRRHALLLCCHHKHCQDGQHLQERGHSGWLVCGRERAAPGSTLARAVQALGLAGHVARRAAPHPTLFCTQPGVSVCKPSMAPGWPPGVPACGASLTAPFMVMETDMRSRGMPSNSSCGGGAGMREERGGGGQKTVCVCVWVRGGREGACSPERTWRQGGRPGSAPRGVAAAGTGSKRGQRGQRGRYVHTPRPAVPSCPPQSPPLRPPCPHPQTLEGGPSRSCKGGLGAAGSRSEHADCE